MENKTIARTLRLFSQLMELHNENPFKIKSLASAAFKVDKLPFRVAEKTLPELEKVDGLGKSTAAKVIELIETGAIAEMSSLIEATPEGVIEIMGIKGLGPKKVLVIWKDLGIESIGELYYACNENRLIEAKGFGLKTQEEIRNAIEFKIASNGRYLFAQTEEVAEPLILDILEIVPDTKISFVGEYRRKCEIIDSLEILIGSEDIETFATAIAELPYLTIIEKEGKQLVTGHQTGIKVDFNFCSADEFITELAFQTGTESHIAELKSKLGNPASNYASEEEIYAKAGIPYIEPELREGIFEFELAAKGKMPELVEWQSLKGSLHNHSTWSDGVHSLEEMALFCRDELKLEYLGICDHSKTAVYAKGLSEERVLAQHAEIDQLNAKLGGFKIFKGIESDILFDGSLDYSDDFLSRFDFVVASIHSVFRMTEEKATSRLIKAIENPYTTILGHPTGRLLLSRNGYPINYEKVIDACAANGVVIEINANPLRLDLDWRWHQYALNKGVRLSINPDAHKKEAFYHTRYGILAARKGGVTAADCLNALSANEISAYFKQRKGI